VFLSEAAPLLAYLAAKCDFKESSKPLFRHAKVTNKSHISIKDEDGLDDAPVVHRIDGLLEVLVVVLPADLLEREVALLVHLDELGDEVRRVHLAFDCPRVSVSSKWMGAETALTPMNVF
jgi:hypothetical protein